MTVKVQWLLQRFGRRSGTGNAAVWRAGPGAATIISPGAYHSEASCNLRSVPFSRALHGDMSTGRQVRHGGTPLHDGSVRCGFLHGRCMYSTRESWAPWRRECLMHRRTAGQRAVGEQGEGVFVEGGSGADHLQDRWGVLHRPPAPAPAAQHTVKLTVGPGDALGVKPRSVASSPSTVGEAL